MKNTFTRFNHNNFCSYYSQLEVVDATGEVSGTGSVYAYGDTYVNASENANVYLTDYSTCTYYNDGKGKYNGNCEIHLDHFSSATVTGTELTEVFVNQRSTLQVQGSAVVEANDKATIDAYDNVEINVYSPEVTIRVHSKDVVINIHCDDFNTDAIIYQYEETNVTNFLNFLSKKYL